MQMNAPIDLKDQQTKELLLICQKRKRILFDSIDDDGDLCGTLKVNQFTYPEPEYRHLEPKIINVTAGAGEHVKEDMQYSGALQIDPKKPGQLQLIFCQRHKPIMYFMDKYKPLGLGVKIDGRECETLFYNYRWNPDIHLGKIAQLVFANIAPLFGKGLTSIEIAEYFQDYSNAVQLLKATAQAQKNWY